MKFFRVNSYWIVLEMIKFRAATPLPRNPPKVQTFQSTMTS